MLLDSIEIAARQAETGFRAHSYDGKQRRQATNDALQHQLGATN